MEINNLEQITGILEFTEGDFYFVQVIQRRKENPEIHSNSRLIKAYYIESERHLRNVFPEMVKLSEAFNARVYISLNRKNYIKCNNAATILLLQYSINKALRNSPNAFNSACGKSGNVGRKTWIVDIDEDLDSVKLNYFKEYINRLKPEGDKAVATIPTPHGCHLITTPFDLSAFKQTGAMFDIHKDNPTILYANV